VKDINIKFISYDSAQDLVVKYFRYDYPRMGLDNLLKKTTEFELNFDGNKNFPSTVSEVIEVVEDLGLWGFCDRLTHGDTYPNIHYWVGNKAKRDKAKIMELFAHEISHAVGYDSEAMAVKFGGVAAFSYMTMMEEIYSKNTK